MARFPGGDPHDGSHPGLRRQRAGFTSLDGEIFRGDAHWHDDHEDHDAPRSPRRSALDTLPIELPTRKLCTNCAAKPVERGDECSTCRRYRRRKGHARPPELTNRQGELNGRGPLQDGELIATPKERVDAVAHQWLRYEARYDPYDPQVPRGSSDTAQCRRTADGYRRFLDDAELFDQVTRRRAEVLNIRRARYRLAFLGTSTTAGPAS